MGTRNLIAVMVGGEYKVAQYCQWDGYPKGQGRILLEALRILDLAKLADKCANAKWIPDEKLEARWKKFGAKDGWVKSDSADRFKKAYPHLHRDTGAEIINIIAKANRGIELQNDIAFAKDSLFCEWCYVVDFDKRTFEVYEGGKVPVRKKDRFPGTMRHRASFDLDKLPNLATFYRVLGVKG